MGVCEVRFYGCDFGGVCEVRFYGRDLVMSEGLHRKDWKRVFVK